MNYLEAIKKYSFFSLAPLLSAIIQLLSVFLIGHSLSDYELGLAGIFNTLIFILVFISDGGSSNYFIYKVIMGKREVNVINILNIFVSVFSISLFFILSQKSFHFKYSVVFCFFIISLTITLPLYKCSRLLVEKKFNTIASIELLSKIVFIISLAVLLYFVEIQSASVVYAWAISYFVRFISLQISSKNIFLYDATEIYQVDSISTILKKWWSYVHNQIFSQVINYITLTADIFIISHFGGVERVGAYSLCKDATLKISSVISPVISKLFISFIVTSDLSQLKLIYKRVFFMVLVIAVSVFFSWCLLGPYILKMLKPNLDYGFEIFIYAWAICGVLRMMINPVTSIFQGIGQTRKELYVNMVSFASFLILFLVLSMTVTGEVIANKVLVTLIGMYVISFIFSSWMLKKTFLKI